MDKLVADGRKVTISNDGATIMRLLEIEHPAAKTLVDISMSQVRFIYLQQLLSFFLFCKCVVEMDVMLTLCNIILY
jgi:hypothetical protein